MAEIIKLSQSGKGNRPRRGRFVPAVITILFLIALAIMAPLLVKYRDAPETLVAKLEAMSQTKPAAPSMHMKHSVWVNKRSGLYYCRDSRFYGKMRPGTSMRQESALMKGFRPAQGQTCP
jgi:hypothetical protein